MKTVLITGVSTGIGYGTTKELVPHGYRVIGTVRKQADADRMRAELGNSFHPLLLDVTDSESVSRLPEQVSGIVGNEGLYALINNAGMIIPGPVQLQPLAEVRRQFEVNVFGLVEVTQALLPLLGAPPARGVPLGRILNVSSVGGLIAAPFISAYAASKHAVEGFSHSLRRELRPFGIQVVIIGPGSVKTAIWEKGGTHGANPAKGTAYEGMMERFQNYASEVEQGGFTPEEFGKLIRPILETPKPKVRYALVPKPLVDWHIPRLLPHAILDGLMARTLGLESLYP